MKHFLAYGNSDQASFRDRDVRNTFDFMTVPGTIASYYEDATAAFVLSSRLKYVIDPRTPLFQGDIGQPRASHKTLAGWMSPSIFDRLTKDDSRVRFTVEDYDDDVIEDIAQRVITAQREYGKRTGGIADKMSRYRRLLAKAMGQELEPLTEGQPPSFVLAPYFVISETDDAWRDANLRILQSCLALDDPTSISAVVAAMSIPLLREQLDALPTGLSSVVFFWVSGFDERDASIPELRAMKETVEQYTPSFQLVNMYGGFYSISLGALGLWGVNNGLGYSESRSWPELPATGAAPARYYVPKLHRYLPPRTAQFIMDVSTDYWCECPVCQDRVAGGTISIVDLPYHDIKKHFALTRSWEMGLVDALGTDGLAGHMHEEFDRFEEEVSPEVPRGLRIDVSHLHRWSKVLGGAP